MIIPKITLDFLDRGDRPKNKKCPYREQEGAPCTGLIARATRERYAQTHAGCAVQEVFRLARVSLGTPQYTRCGLGWSDRCASGTGVTTPSYLSEAEVLVRARLLLMFTFMSSACRGGRVLPPPV